MSIMKLENNEIMRTFKYQIIGGKIVSMAPLANPNHGKVSNRINIALSNYFDEIGGNYEVYHDNNYLRLDIIAREKNIVIPEEYKKDKYIPDVMVCDNTIDTMKGVIGAPVLIAEVLSKGTEDYDRKIKKDVYEQIGVNEYWIIDPGLKSINIYILQDGKYVSYKTYYKYSEDEIELIKYERQEMGKTFEIVKEFSPYIFPDLKIKINDVFKNLIKE